MSTVETKPGSSTPTTRRLLSWILNGAFWLFFLLVLFLAYGSIPNRFYQVMFVNSGSMSPTFEAGDLIVITPPPTSLQPGMVLTMVVNGGIVTHRLIDVTPAGELVTKGDANPVVDQWTDAVVAVRGLYRFHIPRLGLLLNKPMQMLRGGETGSWFNDFDQMEFSVAAAWATATPTPTPGATDPGCTLTAGYWKNHPDAWPAGQLDIGARTYLQPELLELLDDKGGSDVTLKLAVQLIAAKLNVLHGADPTVVAVALQDADQFLVLFPPSSDPKDKPIRRLGNSLAESLDSYNNGLSGPGTCSEEQEEPVVEYFLVPSLTATATPTATPLLDSQIPGEITLTPTATQVLPTQPDISPSETPTPTPQATETASPTETPLPEPTATEPPAPVEQPTQAPTQPG